MRMPPKLHCTIAAATACLLAIASIGHASDWTNTSGGDFNNSGNWSGGVPNGVGAVADFSTLDFSGDVSVTVNGISPTLGQLLLGDTNPATGTSWEFRSDDATLPVITLDNGGSVPVISVGELGAAPATFDDAYIGVPLAGTNGFEKNGSGILTIGADSTGLSGAIMLNAGTIRVDASGAIAGDGTAPLTMADGTALVFLGDGAAVNTATVASGATATIRFNGGSNFLNTIQSDGTGTLNLESAVAGSTISGDGDWVSGGSFAVVNMTGNDAAGVSFFRARVNGGGFNAAAFQNSTVNLDNIEFFARTNSFGNDVLFGALNGTATAELRGGHGGSGGSAVRYIIGGLNTDSEFAGVVDGRGGESDGPFGGMSIDKIGTGTHTFSGTFDTSLVGPNTDIGRQGGVIRVSEGTLAFTNTADSVPGGSGTLKSTIDVLAGATLDVSGTTNTFSSSPLQQIQGSGTIVGAFNHDEGEIRPGDVSTPDNDSTLTNVPIPTVGTLNFNGNLSFNGGSIVFDMNETPGSDDLISVTGTTSVAGGGVVNPNFLGADPAVGTTYTFLTSSGGFSDSLSGWSVAWPGRGASPTVFIDGNDLKFTTTAIGAGGSVIWTGAVNGTWDIQSTQNWSLGGSPDVFFNDDDVEFNDTGANPAITLAEAVSPRNVVIDSSTNNYSFTGNSILATGTLTKRGTSTLTLDNTNTFTSVTIEGGTVDTSGANQTLGTGALTMSGASIINIGNGGSLGVSSLEATAGTSNSLQYTGSGGAGSRPYIPTLTGSGEVTVTMNTDGSWINVGNLNNFSGTLTIQPDGTNAIALGTARTGGAGGSMPNGVLNLVAVTIANQNGGSGEITQAYGELHADADSVLSGFVGGSGTIPNVNWEIGGLNTDSNVDGIIQDGAGGGDSVAVSRVTKVGAGTLTLSGVNTYTGDTTVEGGTLSITNPFLNDAADVFIDAGAILDLAFGGADIIDSLYLGGDPQAVGTYGAIGNGSADFQTAFITGSGLLSVSTLGDILTTPGDFNGDDNVDGLDFLVWQQGFGATYDAADLADWQANYGTAAAGPTASGVPEPTAAVLCLLAGLAAWPLRKRLA
ncbi:MAG: hypothetical protein CMJ58_28355 [Planctomycetaceae bacterium]|nr:hypothetical protein [Planctomycetaceae bacterium]